MHAFAAGPRVLTPRPVSPGGDGLATEFNGRHQCDIEARPLPGPARARQRSLRLEQLEVRQMLAGIPVAGMVSSGWFGSYAADQPLHAVGPFDHGQRDVDCLRHAGREQRPAANWDGSCRSTRRRAAAWPVWPLRPVCCPMPARSSRSSRSGRGGRSAGTFLWRHGRPGIRSFALRPADCLVRTRLAALPSVCDTQLEARG